jgi:Ribonuclease G/E
MAKQRVHVKTTTKRRVRKTGGNSGYKKCPNCGGDGRVKVRK